MSARSPLEILEEFSPQRLYALAAGFVLLLAVTLSLSPIVRARSLDGGLRGSHWAAVAVWVAVFALLARAMDRREHGGDPLLLPLTALLTGWGLLTIWRLTSTFGLRQSVWLVIGAGVFFVLMRVRGLFSILRQYKYIFLFGGLLLTALTILLGTNPLGFGPRLWLGCCGVYLQPSEPLKLLLIIYLAAYLADRQPFSTSFLSLIIPTLIVISITTGILLVQRDLGTATVFLFIYTVVIFVATGNRLFLAIGTASLMAAGLLGTVVFDLVRLRVDAWLNPWLDPSGRSYQIVQSLIAIASGGAMGRGIGIGNPGLVPVPHSDFIYTSIAEEHGVVGALALLALLGLLIVRGLQIAMQAGSRFHRYLAIGISAYLGGQSLLIIGGTIRLLPLTGVTLPFLSYGGSSLVSSFVALALLQRISTTQEGRTRGEVDNRPTLLIGGVLLSGLLAAGLVTGWWGFVRGPDLQTRTDNARRAIADRVVLRGALLDVNGVPIHTSLGTPGAYQRAYIEPGTGNLYGYTHPIYGQSGAEQGFDEILRGEQYQPALLLWFHHLMYGQPPHGLDVLTSIDIELQQRAQEALGATPGAVVMLDVTNGNLLALASSPNYDPAELDAQWTALIEDANAPLVNRATQGSYPPGGILMPFLIAENLQLDLGDAALEELPVHLAENTALLPLMQRLFSTPPQIAMPVSGATIPLTVSAPENLINGRADFSVSPLQIALAYGSLVNGGRPPTPVFGISYRDVDGAWIELPRPEAGDALFGPVAANAALADYTQGNGERWLVESVIEGDGRAFTWLVSGAVATGRENVVIVVLLEDNAPTLAEAILQQLLRP